jgi:hypothetical protein
MKREQAQRAAYAATVDAYRALPADTRARLNIEFKQERARSPALTWARYLDAILTLLPAEAR